MSPPAVRGSVVVRPPMPRLQRGDKMSTPSPPRAFRAVPLVLGSVLGLIALAVVVAGAFALWAHETQRDADGFLTTPTELLASPTHAIVSEPAHIVLGAPDWISGVDRFGTIRIHAQGPHGLPVFVGIGPAADVEAYLAGVRYDEVSDLSYGPFSVDYRRHEGGAPASAPAEQTFWAASAEGTGDQLATWRLAEGDWRIVALNPDGSAGVEAYVAFGARVAFLGTLAWTLLGIGAALLVVAGVLVYVGARRAPAAPPAPPAVPAVPPPAPAPRAPERELVGVGADREEHR
jgi:hypothetical protein